MKRLLIGIGVFLLVVLALLFIVPMLIPTDTYRSEIADRFRAATGRELAIKGNLSLSLIPSVSLTARDVVVGNAKGAPSSEFAKIKRLDFGLRLFPLIGGEIDVKRLVLVEPQINLETSKNGKPNWSFGSDAPSTSPKPATQPKKIRQKPKSDGKSFASRLRLGEIRVENATVNYRSNGRVQSYRNINVTVSGSLPTEPVTLKGSLKLRGKPLQFDVRVSTPSSLQTAKGATLAATFVSEAMKITLASQVQTKPEIKATGNLMVDVPSISNLMAWIGNGKKPRSSGPDRIKLSSPISVSSTSISLTNFKLTIDKVASQGNLTVVMGPKPTIRGKASFAALDLNPYLGAGKSSQRSPAPASPQKDNQAKKAPSLQPKPGWSTTPIDLSALNLVNLDYEIDAKKVSIGRATVNRANIHAKLVNGALTLTLKDLGLYKGKGTGVIRVAARGSEIVLAPQLKLTGISVLPLLRDVAGMKRLEGTGNLSLNVSGKGRNQRDIMSSLAGKLNFKFTDGAIRGVNIAAMLRSASPGALTKGFDPAQKTDFASFSASFVGTRGSFATRDLQLQAPLLRMTGTGSVHLPPRTVNFTLKPKLVGTIKGQKSKFDLAGVTVPVKVSGPWDNPTFRPDLSAAAKEVIKDPSKIKDLGEKLKNSKPKDILKKIVPQIK